MTAGSQKGWGRSECGGKAAEDSTKMVGNTDRGGVWGGPHLTVNLNTSTQTSAAVPVSCLDGVAWWVPLKVPDRQLSRLAGSL